MNRKPVCSKKSNSKKNDKNKFFFGEPPIRNSSRIVSEKEAFEINSNVHVTYMYTLN